MGNKIVNTAISTIVPMTVDSCYRNIVIHFISCKNTLPPISYMVFNIVHKLTTVHTRSMKNNSSGINFPLSTINVSFHLH